MVAVVAGNGLGLFNTSANVLGSAGMGGSATLGQAGGRAYVNAATGNLVLQGLDDELSGTGVDLDLLRTYNSLGNLSDAGADGWSWDGESTVVFNVASAATAPGTAGTTVTRTTGDGDATVYTWNAATSSYVSTDGGGANDSLKYSAGHWTWTDGSTQEVDVYGDSTSSSMTGLLQSRTDTSGHVVTFGHDSLNRLTTITDGASGQQNGGSGQQIQLVYSTTSPFMLLQANTYELQTDANGVIQTPPKVSTTPIKQVEYTYDNGRIGTVKTVLNPGKTPSTYLVTTYTYAATTGSQITSVTQNDGSDVSMGTPYTVSFVYYPSTPPTSSSGKLWKVLDGNGLQTYTYNANSTDVKISAADGSNPQTWTYSYDANKQLTQIQSPAPTSGAARLSTMFQYDASGNVTKITDANGKSTIYQYDANGNCILQRDQLGDTVSRTYDAKNQLLTQTTYLTADAAGLDAATVGAGSASGGLTTYYAYDSNERLRFTVSPQGRVTENRYGTNGLLERTVQYTATSYTGPTPDLAGMTSWASTAIKSGIELTQYQYDFRGNLSQVTSYANTDATGAGILDAAATVMQYVYDGHGDLLQKMEMRGTTPVTLSTMAYDGLGRQIKVITAGATSDPGLPTATTTTVYNDKTNTITVTNAAGLSTVSSYDGFDRLTSVSQSATGISARTTQYFYDAQGRLQKTVDPQGNSSFSYYDAAGRLQYTVDATGAVTGFAYDGDGHLTSQVRYANPVTGGAIANLVADAANDRTTTYVYDDANRLTTTSVRQSATSAPIVTTMLYDGLSRLTSQAVGDRTTRYYYDGDGRVVGMLDPQGYLTENRYDAAGRLVDTARYSARSPMATDVTGPVWIGVADQTVKAGQPFSYRASAYDADGDPVTYSVVGKLPDWLTLTSDPTGAVLSGTAPAAIAPYDVTLQASDGSKTPTTVHFQISAVGATPTWTNLADVTAEVHTTLNLSLPAATTADGSTLTYTAAGLPHGLTLNGATISGTPDTPGSFTVTMTATDPLGGHSVQKSFSITVTNQGPKWGPPQPTQDVFVNTPISVILPPAVDPDGEALTYQVITLPAGLVFDASNPNAPTITGKLMSLGVQTIVLQATDPHGALVQLSFNFNVSNRAPTWPQAPAFIATTAGVTINKMLSTLPTDPDNETLTYSATGLPPGLSVVNGAIVGAATQDGVFTAIITATDPHGASCKQTLSLSIADAPPVWNGLPPNTNTEFTSGIDSTVSIALPGSFTDANDQLSLAYGISGNPSWMKISSTYPLTLQLTIPAGLKTPSITTITLSASAEGLTAFGSFVLTIDADPHGSGGGTGPGGGNPTPPHVPNVIVAPTAPSRPTAPIGTAPTPTLGAALAPAPAPLLAPAMVSTPVDWLAGVRPSDTTALHSYTFYDGEGRVTGMVDSKGFLTETVYGQQVNDALQTVNTLQTITYKQFVVVGATDTLATLKNQAITGWATRTPATPPTIMTTTTFDQFDRVASVKGNDNTLSTNEYDAAGRLVRHVVASGTADQESTRTFYDAFGEVVGTLGGEGDAALVALANQHPLTQADIDSTVASYGTSYQYDSLGRRTQSVDAHSNRTLYFYDADGRLTHTLDASGGVTETQYNAFGQVKSSTRYATPLTGSALPTAGGADTPALKAAVAAVADATKDQTTSYTYDMLGELHSATDALGFVTTDAYDVYGQLSSQTRAIDSTHSTTTQFGYDLRGDLVSTSRDAGGLDVDTQTTYDAYGRVTSSVDATGKVTNTLYADSGRTVTVSLAALAGHQTTTSYDMLGRVLCVKDGNGQTTKYVYDDVLHTIAVTMPAPSSQPGSTGPTVTTWLSAEGQALKVQDADGNTTTYTYNKDGELWTVTDALGDKTTNKYDSGGFLSSTIDARNIVTHLVYDALERVVTRVVDPITPDNPLGLSLSTTYQFNALGQQVLVTEGAGTAAARATSYSYDLDGRLKQVVVDPTGLKLATTYSYDGLGDTLHVSQGTVSSPNQQVTQYTYDSLGRRTSEIDAPSAVLGSSNQPHERDLVTQYRYDADGRLTRRIDAAGNSTWYVYDAAGELTQTVNALGSVSESTYDADGRVVQTRNYVNAVSTAGFGDVVTNLQLPAIDNNDQRNYLIYDNDGRLRFTLRAHARSQDGAANMTFLWDISESRYDANGNVVEARIYDRQIDESVLSTLDPSGSSSISVDQMVGALQDPTGRLKYNDSDPSTLSMTRITHYVYDAANRLSFTIDSLGGTTENVYDPAGNVTATVRYAKQLPAQASYDWTTINGKVDRTNAANEASYAVYDDAGRVVYSALVVGHDAQSVAQYAIAKSTYDALGHVVGMTQYATATALSDLQPATFDATIKKIAGTQDRSTLSAYDAAGRQVYSLAGLYNAQGVLGYVASRLVYDAMGNITQSTQFSTIAAPPADLSLGSIAKVVLSASQDRTTSYVYDALGRRRFVVAADRSLSETVYDDLGQVTEVRQFADPVPSNTALTETDLANARAGHAVGDGVTRGEKYSYDAVGHVVKTTDAMGASETTEYNALGERLHFVDKNGNLWTYDYDRLGRVYTQTAPPVLLQLSNETTPSIHSLQTRYDYDTFGYLKLVTAALNTPDMRLTSYKHDQLGRVTEVGLPGYYDPATAQVYSAFRTGSFIRTLDTAYDTFGNAVRTTLKTGFSTYQYEYKTYDALDRVTYDVDALNNVTGFSYDVFGDQTAVTRYSVSVGAPAGGLWTSSALAAKVSGDSLARKVSMAYDALGRKICVTQPSVGSNYDTSTEKAYVDAGTTRFDYDAFGDLVHQASWIGGSGSTQWQDTFTYFDAMGRATTTVDALGYQTHVAYDALGNVIQKIEYANAGAKGTPGSNTPPATPAPSANVDRITGYLYDALNRQTDIQQYGLVYSQWNAASGTYDQIVEGATQALTVSHTTYDKLGDVLTQTDAGNNVTTNEYNALGQLTKSKAPARLTAGSSVDPFQGQVNTCPVTTNTYNGFGEIVQQVRSPGAGAGATVTTKYTFDAAGNLIASTDGRGNVTTLQVDYAGRVIDQKQVVSVSQQDVESSTVTGYTHVIEKMTAYDAAGHQTDSVDVYTDASGVRQLTGERSVYDAFGEVTQQRRISGTASAGLSAATGPLVTTYGYDAAGRMVSKTAGDGLTTYLYDDLGHLVRQEQHGDGTGAARVTETVYDVLGRAVLQRLPAFTAMMDDNSLQLVTPVTEESYDRWGNVVSRSQGGYYVNTYVPGAAQVTTDKVITTYEYNASNQVIAEHMATVSDWNDLPTGFGSSTSLGVDNTNETQVLRYDLMGHAVQEVDLAADLYTGATFTLRTRTQVFDGAGELTQDIDGTGYVTRYAYDGDGNRVGTLNGDGNVYVDQFDANGNLTAHNVLRKANGTAYNGNAPAGATPVLVQINRYKYDQANRRYFVANNTNNAATSNASYVTVTNYDERNQVVKTWQASTLMQTDSYDSFGDKTSTTDASGHVQGWQYDLADDFKVGQLTHSTVAGQTTDYGYDGFGQRLSEKVGTTALRTYTYHENGQLASTTNSDWNAATSEVDTSSETDDYTTQGQLARQYVSTRVTASDQSTWLIDDQATRTTYDALGRVKHVDVTGQKTYARGVDYGYDALGDRRWIGGHYLDAQTGATTGSSEYYDYDAEGRLTLIDGQWNGQGSIKADANSTVVTYDQAGRRATATTYVGVENSAAVNGVGEQWDAYRQQSYGYNDLGYLTSIYQTMQEKNLVTVVNGNAGSNGVDGPVNGTLAKEVRNYDDSGKLLSDDLYADVVETGTGTVLSMQYVMGREAPVHTANAYGQLGNVSSETVTNPNGPTGTITDTFTYWGQVDGNIDHYKDEQTITDANKVTLSDYTTTYQYSYALQMGGYKVSSIKSSSTKPGSTDGSTTNTYDTRGNLIYQLSVSNGVTEGVDFTYDVNGQVTAKYSKDGTQQFVYEAGHQIAVVGSGSFAMVKFSDDFTPISAAYPGSTPGTYSVTSGDTLSSIAQNVFGDSSLWYLIAEANNVGYGPNDPMPTSEVGKTYVIPNVVANTHNDASSFQPYDPASIIGSAAPQPAGPTPPACNWIAQVVSTAVNIVVSKLVTAVALATPLAPLAFGLGAAAGSAAGQVTDIELDSSKSWSDFSGRQVLDAGVDAAITQGVTDSVPGATGLDQEALRLAGAALTPLLNPMIDSAISGSAPKPFAWGDYAAQLGAALLTPLSSELDGTNFKFGTQLQGALLKAFEPDSGWYWKDSSRTWSTLLTQALNTATSIAVGGVASYATPSHARSPSAQASAAPGVASSISVVHPSPGGQAGPEPDAISGGDAGPPQIDDETLAGVAAAQRDFEQEQIQSDAGSGSSGPSGHWITLGKNDPNPEATAARELGNARAGQLLSYGFNGLKGNREWAPGKDVYIPGPDEYTDDDVESAKAKYDAVETNDARKLSLARIAAALSPAGQAQKWASFTGDGSLVPSSPAIPDDTLVSAVPFDKLGSVFSSPHFGDRIDYEDVVRKDGIVLAKSGLYAPGLDPETDALHEQYPDAIFVTEYPAIRSSAQIDKEAGLVDLPDYPRWRDQAIRNGTDSSPKAFFADRDRISAVIDHNDYLTNQFATFAEVGSQAILAVGGAFLAGPGVYAATNLAAWDAGQVVGRVTGNEDAALVASSVVGLAVGGFTGSIVESIEGSLTGSSGALGFGPAEVPFAPEASPVNIAAPIEEGAVENIYTSSPNDWADAPTAPGIGREDIPDFKPVYHSWDDVHEYIASMGEPDAVRISQFVKNDVFPFDLVNLQDSIPDRVSADLYNKSDGFFDAKEGAAAAFVKGRTLPQTAATVVHEGTHFLQYLETGLDDYHLGHEFDAVRAQGRIDPTDWSNYLNDQDLYAKLKPMYPNVRLDPNRPGW